MNHTKWEEIRLAMYALDSDAPRWRTRDVESRFVSLWDGDWFYHFSEGGYKAIEWLELKIETPSQEHCILEILQKIHVPVCNSHDGIKILGYVTPGENIAYAASQPDAAR
jgi:hypothetical protein